MNTNIILANFIENRKTVNELIDEGKSFTEINEYFQKYDETIESELENYGMYYTEIKK